MSFRTRITISAAAAVALAIIAASFVVYAIVRTELRAEVDESLHDRARAVFLEAQGPLGFTVEEPLLGGPSGYAQLVTSDGQVARRPDARIALPVGRAREVAAGTRDSFYEDDTVAGIHVRILTKPLAPGVALQIARPLDEVDRTLDRLALLLAAVSLGGIGLAALAGLLVARTALAPVRRMTETAEHVTATTDLSRRIDRVAGDELGRLAASFNAMLGALGESQRAQQRLVADASHELRTPLTSLRTNVDVLERGKSLPPEERNAIVADVRAQLVELTRLVEDLLELARGSERRDDPEPVRLDELVGAAVDRARILTRDVVFDAKLEPSTVVGVPRRIDRAVANLLDNAAKWSPPGGRVEVIVHDGEVAVRDDGPGIAGEDVERVFDRFYRANDARRVPGSGLGLAIVRDVAEEHGGTVAAGAAPGGGAELRLKLLTAS
ncbi:MAG TPA: HAMP domain-containing sensor histidine kinase [Gaiellaceae bacterium]|nr:HAMP domain-containing sensor histidine kinase [Gaiellaceae bacterium]